MPVHPLCPSLLPLSHPLLISTFSLCGISGLRFLACETTQCLSLHVSWVFYLPDTVAHAVLISGEYVLCHWNEWNPYALSKLIIAFFQTSQKWQEKPKVAKQAGRRLYVREQLSQDGLGGLWQGSFGLFGQMPSSSSKDSLNGSYKLIKYSE